MPYNFDQIVNRDSTSCVKYDLRQTVFGNPDVLPMWVADMDIPTPDFIMDALRNRLNHPILGYTFRDNEYLQAITWWYKSFHNWDIKAEWIDFCPGVVSGISHAIRALTQPGDGIIIQPPVYPPFFSTVINNHRRVIENPLLESNGKYYINFELLEQQAKQGAKMLILSSPHNPVGRLWTKDELLEIGSICLKNNIIIISDEIHSDLVYPGQNHISIASLSEELAAITVTFGSISKTFNTAGLASGFAIIPNNEVKKKYADELDASGAGMGNAIGMVALKAAFTPDGKQWLNQLMRYLEGNVKLFISGLQQFTKIKAIEPQATYLIWLDFRNSQLDDEKLSALLIKQAGLGFSPGTEYGRQGSGFMRVNVACSRLTIEMALEQLKTVANHF